MGETNLKITGFAEMTASRVSFTTPGSKSMRITLGGVEDSSKKEKDYAIKCFAKVSGKPNDTRSEDSNIIGRGGALWLRGIEETSDGETTECWVKVNRHDLCSRLGIDQSELERAEADGTHNAVVEKRIKELQDQYSLPQDVENLAARVSRSPKKADSIARFEEAGLEEIDSVISHLQGLKAEIGNIKRRLGDFDASQDKDVKFLRKSLTQIDGALTTLEGYKSQRIADAQLASIRAGIGKFNENEGAALKRRGIFRESGATDILKKVRSGEMEIHDDRVDDFSRAVIFKELVGQRLAFPTDKERVLTELKDKVDDPSQNTDDLIVELKKLFSPKEDYQLFEQVMRMLNHATEHSETSGMGARNLGIVFGPRLFSKINQAHPEKVPPYNAQNGLVEFIIEHADPIFSD